MEHSNKWPRREDAHVRPHVVILIRQSFMSTSGHIILGGSIKNGPVPFVVGNYAQKLRLMQDSCSSDIWGSFGQLRAGFTKPPY